MSGPPPSVGPSELLVRVVLPLEPEDDLRGHYIERRHTNGIAPVELPRNLQEKISLDRVAAAKLEPRHRRIPGRGARRAADRAEPEVIDPRCDIQTGKYLVSSFDRR